MEHRIINYDDLGWWPEHARSVFAAIGRAMGHKRLVPETLPLVPSSFGSVLPGHLVRVIHVPGKLIGRRKGHYLFEIEGPVFAGRWGPFPSGKLEKLAKLAADVR
jgi:hypothetical protein